MAGETIITVVGNLTSDPELRFTRNGVAVANVSIASTPRTYDKQSEEWKDGKTLFVRGAIWREYGENTAASLTKGMRVIATGALTQEEYTTSDGEKRTSLQLDIHEIGPALRYATAVVTRTKADGSGAKDSAKPKDEAPAASEPIPDDDDSF